MQIIEGVETGKLYYCKRSDSWDWFGTMRWWEIFIEPLGFNGVGGLWLKEHWRWNGSLNDCFPPTVKSLGYEESQEILIAITQCAKC